MGFPGGSVGKNPPADAGDSGSIPRGEYPLEKEMATHSCIIAWRIPWTAGYSPRGHKRVRHNLLTKQQQVCICCSQNPNLSHLTPFPLG